ncbi:MAG: glycosyltransferase [Paludibacteraceae bacterium]|nr:glycosyltransferase [Paludibacteraceae bacterium]
MQETPLVSICCITYNHAPFIRKCLDGFLMQEKPSCVPADAKMSDWCEILIHDDCSTDGTIEILKEYEAKYPELIFPLYEETNQYSNGKADEIDFYNYKRAKGKYIAYCEGDDYWTEPLKLQRQVDFLEANEKYTACFHEFIMNNILTGEKQHSKYPYSGDFDVTHKSFICEPYNSAHPMTMVFRVSAFSFEWQKHYKHYRDTMETFHIIRNGKGRFLRFVGGVYNMHKGGVSSQMPRYERARLTLPTYLDMYSYTHDHFFIKKIIDTSLWALKICDEENHPNEKKKVYKLLFKHTPFIALKTYFVFCKRKTKKMLGIC